MAAASAEPHPSFPVRLPYLPLLNFFPGINKRAARGGRLRRSRPHAAHPPTALPGPVQAQASELRLQPNACQSACARQRRELARLFLPPSRSGHFRAGRDLQPDFESSRFRLFCCEVLGSRPQSEPLWRAAADLPEGTSPTLPTPSAQQKTFLD